MIVLVSMLLAAAATTEQLYIADYEIQATRVTRDGSGAYAPRVENLEISNRPILRIEDEIAVFEWQVFDVKFDVRVTNRIQASKAETLVLLLDRAELFDYQGHSHGLAFFFSDGNPKDVRPGKSGTYRLVPSGHKELRTTLFGPPIAGRVAESPQELQKLYADQVGRMLRLRLPVQAGDRVYRYEFDMKVTRTVPRLMPKERF